MRAILPLFALALACADEVRLVDGRVLDGEVISPPDAEVLDLRTGSGSLVVVQHFPRAQVAEVRYGTSPRQRAVAAVQDARRRLGDGGDAGEWWALAEQAREAGDPVLQRELAGEVVARDRQHAAARRMLGMVRARGVWMRPAEAAVARGEVLHLGRWVSWPEREAAIAQAEHERQEALARREEREKEARERRIRAAAAAAVENQRFEESTIIPGYSGSYGYGNGCRVVYWPVVNGVTTVNHGTGPGLVVSGSGRSGSSSWSFTWSR